MGILVFLPRKLSKYCCALTLMRTRTRCTTREWALHSKRRRSSRAGRDAWDPHTLIMCIGIVFLPGTVFAATSFGGPTAALKRQEGRKSKIRWFIFTSLRCWPRKNQHRLWCGCVTCMHDWRVWSFLCYKCSFLRIFMM